jgi:ADP-ribose pyrophosphatase YjhB (NUDIX family)
MLELGEPLAAGVAREVREETGLTVEVGALVEVLDRIDIDDEQRVRHHYVLIDYVCRATGGELRAGSDASEIAVADPRALAGFDVTPMVEMVVGRAMQMR